MKIQHMKNVDKVFQVLEEHVKDYNVPVIDLIKVQTNDPFKVLIGTILSARTKDEVTSKVCEKLFKKIKKPSDFNNYSQEEIEKLIFPVGFYKTKAKHLKQLPKVLESEFNNKIPKTIDELIKIPGVGRKTANLVVAVAFSGEGICVDTHVHRITNRISWINTKTPFETEKELRKKLPKKYWTPANRLLVAFGQNLCRPISPHCSKCPISKYCQKIGVEKSR